MMISAEAMMCHNSLDVLSLFRETPRLHIMRVEQQSHSCVATKIALVLAQKAARWAAQCCPECPDHFPLLYAYERCHRRYLHIALSYTQSTSLSSNQHALNTRSKRAPGKDSVEVLPVAEGIQARRNWSRAEVRYGLAGVRSF